VSLQPLLETQKQILTFRATRSEFNNLTDQHLIFGLIVTWIVGMGRYWDDAGAGLLQHLGVGSVIYTFVLSGFLWLLLYPFRATQWNYKPLLTFITLTSLPAILYAIPVEKFMVAKDAARTNVFFLSIVAFYRVSLLIFYLRRAAGFTWFETTVGTLLPLTFIVTTLTALNLNRVVFNIMGGIRHSNPHDGEYGILIILSLSSVIAFVPLLIGYGIIAYRKCRAHRMAST
jgi:hypothetical protein